MRAPSLRTRLFGAFAAVAVVGGLVFAAVVRGLVPTLFDGHMRMNGQGMNGGGMGMGGGSGGTTAWNTRDAVVSSVNTAMSTALAASLAVAFVLALWFSRRTLRHLDHVREGTRALREGNYAAQLASPPEPELRALVDDINELAATLSTVEQRRASLIGDVAHEMRTPLTTIAGHLEGLQDGLFTTEETVTAVAVEVDRLQRFARDLAAVSRAEEGADTLDRTDLDLGALVEVATRRLRPTADAKGVVLVADVQAGVRLRGDAGRLDQVVTNLLTNALAYTDRGGSVTTTVRSTADRAELIVRDEGRGLAPDELRQVFERFYRADPGDHTGGTGVGLTIARSIARAHGGDLVTASGGRGQGATFTLTLPR